MRRRGFMLALGLAVGLPSGAAALDLSWFTIDAGGGRSTDPGGLEVRGTIGQPDAGTHTGGSLVLLGGYWDAGWPTSVATGDGVTVPAPPFALRAAAPNPFRPATTLRYSLPHETDVRLDVYDVAGRRVAVLVRERQPAGHHAVRWDGRDGAGRPAGPGIYFGHLVTDERAATTKLVLAP